MNQRPMAVGIRPDIQSRIDRRTRAEFASLGGTCSNSQRSSFAVSRPSFEAEASGRLLKSPSVSSSPRSPRRDIDLGSLRPTGASGFSCRRSCPNEKRSWSSFSPKPWPAGIARDSGSTGDRSQSPDPVDLRSQLRCRHSFVDLRTRMAGVPEESGLNSRSLGSRSASPLSLDTYQSAIPTTANANGGGRSFAITGMAAPRWTSWSSPPLGSDHCMPGSSSGTGGERSFISG